MTKKVSVAIIYFQKKLLLQLRSKNKDIIHPLKWGFFGGSFKKYDDPKSALKREIYEELKIKYFQNIKLLKSYYYAKEKTIFFIFAVKLKNSRFTINEGLEGKFFLKHELLKPQKSKKLGKNIIFADKFLMNYFLKIFYQYIK